MQKRREKQNKKKQTSRIADNSRKSELKKEFSRCRIAQNARKCARKKEPAACLEILEALKGDAPPDQGGIRADRACLMLNCCKMWHKKEDIREPGDTQGTVPVPQVP